jgi:hypothetical protein
VSTNTPCIADVIEEIVLSPQFRNIRGSDHQGAQ